LSYERGHCIPVVGKACSVGEGHRERPVAYESIDPR